MINAVQAALMNFKAGNSAVGQQMLDEVRNRALIEVYFDEIRAVCRYRFRAEYEPRRGNVMAFEGDWRMWRCLRQSPDGRGALYWASGGDAAVYGLCCCAGCPLGRALGLKP